MHILMVQHGKEVCSSQHPKCGECSLQATCEYGKTPHEVVSKKEKKDKKDKKKITYQENSDDDFMPVKKKPSFTGRRKKPEDSLQDIEDLKPIKKVC
jgi:adenine-specific DNA glycosylase